MDGSRLKGLFEQIRKMLAAIAASGLSLEKLLTVLPYLLPVLTLPDWKVSESVRLWAMKLTDLLDILAEMTDTVLDDKAVDWLNTLVTDDESWFTIYGLFFDAIDSGATLEEARVKAAADKVDLDPTVLIMLVELALQIWSWWKKR